MMMLQKTSTVGTPLQKASSKTSRYILLGHHHAPHPCNLSLTSATCPSPQQGSAGWSRLPGHVSAGSNTCRLVAIPLPLSPLSLDVPGSREMAHALVKTNPSLPRRASVTEEEGFTLTISEAKMPHTW